MSAFSASPELIGQAWFWGPHGGSEHPSHPPTAGGEESQTPPCWFSGPF